MSASSFSLEDSKICRWKRVKKVSLYVANGRQSLTLYQMTRFVSLLTLYHTIQTFNDTQPPPPTHTHREKPFENIVRKSENAGNQVKGFFLRVVKSPDCVVKSKWLLARFFFFSEDKSIFTKSFETEMCEVARTKFAWKKTDNIDLKVADCVRQLQDLLSMRKLVNKKDYAQNLYRFLYFLMG